MSTLLADFRYSARTLTKSPGFTLVALLTLALGIGANTAIFSVVNAVLLRPLPFPEPDRIVAVFQTLPKQGITRNGLSFLNYSDIAARAMSFEEVAAVRMHDYTLGGAGEPALVVGGTVTGSAFSVLRRKPLLGRGISASDDDPAAAPAAVLAEKTWRERFGSDPGIVGKSILLDAQPATVVGVMPRAFRTPPDNPPVELWLSLNHDPVFADLRQRRGGHYLTVLARLKKGVPLERAQAELTTIAADLARRYPKDNEGWGVRLVPLGESLVGGARTALLVLLGAVGLVFLIACANVANLLLVRAAARSREVAIRTALGAGRGRLVRQFLTECLLLGAAGGLLGLSLAVAGMGALRAWLPPDLPRVREIDLDGRVLLFSVAASLTAAVLAGLAPALQASGSDLSEALREGSAGTGESAGAKRLRSLLVIGETAISFVLLIGAGLLGRSFLRLQQVDPGFNPSRLLTAGISLPRSQYSKPEQWIGFFSRVVDRLKTHPGVEGAAAALPLPLNGSGLNFAFKIEGRADEGGGTDLSANYTAATADYFRVMAVKLARGRLLSESDSASSPKVCVISSSFARRFFAGEDPLGRRLVFGFTQGVPRQVVGIVGDVKRDGLAAPSRPEMYVPFVQDPWWAAYLAVRTAGDPERLANEVRDEVRALDPTLPVEGIQPMTQTVYESVAQPRFRATLVGLFGASALLLAVIGIYGVISYNVGRRTREVGIRLALGAGRGDVLRLVFGHGVGLTAIGLVAGVAGALVLTRSVSSLLFEVAPVDPATYVGVAGILLAAGGVACWLPARRAARMDPMVALRAE